jgi:hypothetical protein
MTDIEEPWSLFVTVKLVDKKHPALKLLKKRQEPQIYLPDERRWITLIDFQKMLRGRYCK